VNGRCACHGGDGEDRCGCEGEFWHDVHGCMKGK
jgi:hypothetical protein